MRLDEAVQQYLGHRLAEGRQKRSYWILTVWSSVFGAREVKTITRQEIQWTVDRLSQERGWKPASRTIALNVLSGMYKWLIDLEVVTTNAVQRIPRKAGKALRNERRCVLTPEQMERRMSL